ncbi:MAG TPA: efflux transporter outer membrane subunit [Bryobacteraceae bacterium]|nr:efflux transporter outer membrane subunit [Bryobacteraceae bacterium]
MARAAAAGAGVLTLLLSACTGPHYARPSISVPPSYRGDTMTAGNGQPASFGELRWQDLIRDEALSKLTQEAIAHNFDVQIAAARVLEARAQLTVSRSARFPSVDALASYNNSRSAGLDSNDANLSIGLGWQLDLWGQIRNATAAARAALLASEQARRVVLQTLVSSVVNDYLLLRDLDLEVDITRHELSLREDSLELVQLRVDNGYSSEIDLRQAEVLVKSARTALTSLELEREQTENQLSILLGGNPGPVARGRSLLDQGLAVSLPPGLPSTLLECRPDIRQAEEQLIGDHALVAVARAAFFPTISLTGSSGFESYALAGLSRMSSGSWSFGPAATLPIFNAGATRAGVRTAEARREQSLLAYRKTVQQAFREVADSLAAWRRLAELRTQQEGLVDSLRNGVELADLAYKGGVASYLEYLDSERQLLDAQLQLVQIRREELANVVTLYCALGGGWQ